MNTLVIGGNGQLGRHLREVLPGAEFWDRSVVDLSDLPQLRVKLDAAYPDAIINAAAYTAVDKAESEGGLAWRINAEVPALLARAAHRLAVPLVHVSTDYVFDGRKAGGYVEADAVNPLSAYGRSKLGGELAVRSLCTKHWILRVSWVFSEHRANFPKTMLRLAGERTELRVVDDQRGRPTYARDLADCIAMLLADSVPGPAMPWGLHHVCGGPVVTWKEFATAIISQGTSRNVLARAPNIVGIATSEYPTPAVRPLNSVLDSAAATARYTRAPFDWHRGLDRFFTALHPGG